MITRRHRSLGRSCRQGVTRRGGGVSAPTIPVADYSATSYHEIDPIGSANFKPPAPGDFGAMVRFRPTANDVASLGANVFGQADNNIGGSGAVWCFACVSGNLRVHLRIWDGVVTPLTSVTFNIASLTANELCHAGFKFESSTGKVYYRVNDDSSWTLHNTYAGKDRVYNTSPFAIGDTARGTHPFEGTVAKPIITHTALSDADWDSWKAAKAWSELSAGLQATDQASWWMQDATDSSGNGNTVTEVNSPLYTTEALV